MLLISGVADTIGLPSATCSNRSSLALPSNDGSLKFLLPMDRVVDRILATWLSSASFPLVSSSANDAIKLLAHVAAPLL